MRVNTLVLTFALLSFLGSSSRIPLSAAELYVADAGAGTDFRGALFRIDPNSGLRTLVSDFGDAAQGPLGQNSRAAVIEASGAILVVDPFVGTGNLGALFRIDPSTGLRTILSDFGDAAQGPLGSFPIGVALEPDGGITVTDFQVEALFRIDPATGQRALASDFSDPGQGPVGVTILYVDVEENGNLWISDSSAGTGFFGALFRLDPQSGTRSLVSDFGDPAQGPTASNVSGIAIEGDGNILVGASVPGPLAPGLLIRVDPTTGERTILHDFDPGLGPFCPPLASTPSPIEIAVEEDGGILILTNDTSIGVPGSVLRIDPVSGVRSLLSCLSDPLQGPLGASGTGIDIRDTGMIIFADGFESGDLTAW